MSNEKPSGTRFVFQGSASAFSARIRHPEDLFINAAAPSYLSVIGGLSETTVEGPDALRHSYNQVLTFQSAFSQSKSDFMDKGKAMALTVSDSFSNLLPASTTSHSRLQAFNLDLPPCPPANPKRRVLNAKTLELIQDSNTNRTDDPISFRSLTAVYDGLSLTTGDGPAVPLKVHTVTEIFGQCDTRQKLLDTYSKDADFRKKYAACFHLPGASGPGLLSGLLGKHEIPHSGHGHIAATFVLGLEWEGAAPEGTHLLHNRLTIDGVGRFYFGEILIDDHFRRSNLIRSELGPCVGGEFVCCECMTNGAGTGSDNPGNG